MDIKKEERKSHNFIQNKMHLVAILLLCVILFAFIYEASEVLHECNGEDCPICSCIQHLRQNHAVKTGDVAGCLVCICLCMVLGGYIRKEQFTVGSLVERKVRLND